MSKHPIFAMAASMSLGMLSAGIRPRLSAQALFVAVLLFNAAYALWRCFAGRAHGSPAAPFAPFAPMPAPDIAPVAPDVAPDAEQNAAKAAFVGAKRLFGPAVADIAVATLSCALAVLGHAYCVRAWKGHDARFSEFDGQKAVVLCKVASPVEWKDGKLRVEAVALDIQPKSAAGGIAAAGESGAAGAWGATGESSADSARDVADESGVSGANGATGEFGVYGAKGAADEFGVSDARGAANAAPDVDGAGAEAGGSGRAGAGSSAGAGARGRLLLSLEVPEPAGAAGEAVAVSGAAPAKAGGEFAAAGDGALAGAAGEAAVAGGGALAGEAGAAQAAALPGAATSPGAAVPAEWREAFRYGSVLRMEGTLAKPGAQQNEFLFDYRMYLYARNISALFYIDPGKISAAGSSGPFFPIGAGIALRDGIEALFCELLPEREAALITAILLGKKDGVEERDRQSFMDAGILHIMSVSGLHVAMLGGMVLALFRKAGLGIGRARLASLLAVIAFVFIAGFSASVVRAALTFGIAVAAKAVKRDFDSLNAVGASMCALLAFNPLLVFNAGFQLSYAATLSIILLARKIGGGISGIPAPKSVKSVFAASAAAQLGVFPVQAALFNSFQPFSIPANIAVSPLIGTAMAIGWAVSILGAVSVAAAAYPAYLLLCVMAPLRKIPEWVAALPFSAVSVGTPGMVFFAAYYALLAIVFFGGRRTEPADGAGAEDDGGVGAGSGAEVGRGAEGASGAGANGGSGAGNGAGASNGTGAGASGGAGASSGTGAGGSGAQDGAGAQAGSGSGLAGGGLSARARRIAAMLAAILAAGAALAPWPGFGAPPAMEIVYLDVGNANAAYINIEGKYDIVVDAGGKAEYQIDEGDAASESRLYEYLLGRGVRKIDLAVATHGDSDHMQGFWKLLSEMDVGKMLVSGTEDENLGELLELARQKRVEIIECRAGGALSVGGSALVEVKSPDALPGQAGLSLNDRSLVVRVVFGDFKALFCGDIGFKTEERIMRSGADVSAQIISVPHHGSRYSSGGAFLGAVSAGAAVFGVGKNSYGHPSAEAIERYRDSGARILRTDSDGMITVRGGRDGNMEIKCYNDDANGYMWQTPQPALP
ncbi:MAG: ComEC/Rec2 family competence protein [Clostridiales bacterium]|nr:ComEC/Rec2 family competence protein [Clostridiales bacterium]